MFLVKTRFMNKTSSLCLLCTTAILFSAADAHAGTIAQWTFETSLPATAGPILPEVGSGTGTAVHADATATFSSPSGNGSAASWNSNRWSIGDYYQFQVSTLGEFGIGIAWDHARSSAGPGQPAPANPSFKLQYSTDNSTYTDVLSYVVPVVSTWTSQLADLSGVPALDNQPAVYFRMTAIQSPQNTGGQSRVDNILITSVPEPAGGLLILAAATLVAACCRRR